MIDWQIGGTKQTQACMQHKIVNFFLRRNVDANIGDLEKNATINAYVSRRFY